MHVEHLKSKDSATRHQVPHINVRQHTFPSCGQKFYHPAHLQRPHRRTVEKHYSCFICGQKFPYMSMLVSHSRLHTAEMPYACQICPSKFCKKASLVRHKKLHASGVHLHHCPECDKAFKTPTGLQKHLKWHSKEKPYPCHLCPARFTRKFHLESHVVMHTGEKPHKCPVCERLYARAESLKKHMRRAHEGAMNAEDPQNMDQREASEPPVLLPITASATTLKNSAELSGGAASMDSDLRICDGSAGAPVKGPSSSVDPGHKCNVCGRHYKRVRDLKYHVASHAVEKLYGCATCGLKFTTRAAVVRHRQIHTSGTFACDLCPLKFKWGVSLNRHKRMHASGVDFFPCPLCSKAFTRMKMLQSHLKWHKNEKPFTCHLCPARFVRKDVRDKHVIVVHAGEKAHKCPLCQKSFGWWSSLSAHMRRVHAVARTTGRSVRSRPEVALTGSPPSAQPPDVTCGDLREEIAIPNSPPPSLSLVMESVNIKVEPCSPVTTLSPHGACDDVKEEVVTPEALPPALSPVHLAKDGKSQQPSCDT